MWRTLFMGGYVCALSLGTKGLLHSRQWGAADRSRMKEYTWNENPLSAMNSDSRTREARNFSEKVSNFRKVFIFGHRHSRAFWCENYSAERAACLWEVGRSGSKLPDYLVLFLVVFFPSYFGRTIWLNRKRHSNVPRFFGIQPSGTIGLASATSLYHTNT